MFNRFNKFNKKNNHNNPYENKKNNHSSDTKGGFGSNDYRKNNNFYHNSNNQYSKNSNNFSQSKNNNRDYRNTDFKSNNQNFYKNSNQNNRGNYFNSGHQNYQKNRIQDVPKKTFDQKRNYIRTSLYDRIAEDYNCPVFTGVNTLNDKCPVCNENIGDPLFAFFYHNTYIHFDCLLKQLKSERALGEKQKISYMGSGKFAVVELGKSYKEFKIIEEINIEDSNTFTFMKQLVEESKIIPQKNNSEKNK